jgi:hypothetical protein
MKKERSEHSGIANSVAYHKSKISVERLLTLSNKIGKFIFGCNRYPYVIDQHISFIHKRISIFKPFSFKTGISGDFSFIMRIVPSTDRFLSFFKRQ